jgi:streptomycin 6-kinase
VEDARLRRVAEECAERWALRLGGPLAGGNIALVLAAEREDGTSAVLKVSPPHPESDQEADALAAWDGAGAVRLLEHDRERRALLLERLVPGTSAWEVDEDNATRAVAGVLRRLAIEPPPAHPFRPLAEAAREWAETFPELRSTVEELLADATPQVLLHQDLHAGNVLRRGAEWVAIDPKPLVGDPAFDVASLHRDRRPIRDRCVVERRLDLLADELGHDRERMRRWSWVHAVAWGWPDEARLIRSLSH